MLERYGHGGDLTTAAEAYGLSADDFLDFSSNINPLGPPPVAERLFREAWRDIARYPDPAAWQLRRAIAESHGVPEASVIAGNGAAELIDLAVRAIRPRVTGLARPSFGEYEEAVAKSGGTVCELLLREADDFALRAETVEAKLSAMDALFLGHPNNPTGRLLDPALVRRIVAEGKTLLLDEAFLDFSEREKELTLLREAAVTERLVVIRSLTKFYSLPGIRLGFAVAHPGLIERMRRLQVPWSVNGPAQRIGAQLLGLSEFAEATRAWLAAERPRLAQALEALGLRVFPSDANYLLFRLPREAGFSARDLQQRMGRKGVLIRDASRFAGLDAAYGRVAVKRRGENERLAAVMGEALAELGWRAAGGGIRAAGG